MNRFVVFYTKGNKELADFLTDRAHKLGYEGTSYSPKISVTLDRLDGQITWSTTIDYNNNIPGFSLKNHELGDFEKFFTTDFYKFERKPEIYIGDYKVEFAKDGIYVGCKFVDKKTILAIAKEFEESTDDS